MLCVDVRQDIKMLIYAANEIKQCQDGQCCCLFIFYLRSITHIPASTLRHGRGEPADVQCPEAVAVQ